MLFYYPRLPWLFFIPGNVANLIRWARKRRGGPIEGIEEAQEAVSEEKSQEK
jgi:hypothetical protein